MIGSEFVDILFGFFILAGIEGCVTGGNVKDNLFVVPWSHSLGMVLVWTALYASIALVYFKNEEEKNTIAVLASIDVFSHFLIDFLVQTNDLLLLPNSDSALPSLYLWEFPIVALILEVVFITALWWNFDRGVKAAHMKINTTKSLIALHVVNLFNFASSFGDVEAMKLEGAFVIGVPILILIIIGLIAFLINEDSADQ